MFCPSAANLAPPPLPRVLLIAEGCNPDLTSVPLVGFFHARAIAQLADARVVTHIRNRDPLIAAGWQLHRDFDCIDTERSARIAWKLALPLRGGSETGWTTLTAISALLNYHFEQAIWKRYHRALASGEFDLIHRLVPLSPVIPSCLAAQCRRIGVPFVVGPVNGGLPWPPGFETQRRQEREWLSYLRGAYKLLPGYRSMRARASAIIVGSCETYRQMPRQCHPRCFYIPENGVCLGRFGPPPQRSQPSRPIRAIFVGRLAPLKGADLLLEAAGPLLARGDMKLEIVGDGPQMPLLRAIVQRDALAQSVRLRGYIDHPLVAQAMAAADLLIFPSVREFGGAVVLEAMAQGAVPVVVNYGGPGELVTDKTGFRIELGSRPQIVDRLRQQLLELVERPQLIAQKSPAAVARARQQFTWQAKAAQVIDVYQWVLGRIPLKPHFPMPVPDLDDL